MTLTDLLWKMGAILSVIPALYVYKSHGLLAAVGAYMGSVVILALVSVLGLGLWFVLKKNINPDLG